MFSAVISVEYRLMSVRLCMSSRSEARAKSGMPRSMMRFSMAMSQARSQRSAVGLPYLKVWTNTAWQRVWSSILRGAFESSMFFLRMKEGS